MTHRLPTVWYMSFGMAMLTISVVFAADFLGLVPRPSEAVIEGRKQLAESLAIQCAVCAERQDLDAIHATMQLVVDRNDHIRSSALRAVNGSILAQTNEYIAAFPANDEKGSKWNHAVIPLFSGSEQWGTMEIVFEETVPRGLWGLSRSPLLRLMLFVGLAGFIVYALFLKRALRYLDPNSVVPKRVKAALDNLVEGVALLDKDERIVLANAAFARNTGRIERSLVGLKASELDWKLADPAQRRDASPWSLALQKGQALSAVPLVLSGGPEGPRKVMVNAAPIQDEHGSRQGVLATFDDVTDIEEKNEELKATLYQLNRSREEIRRQNQKLEELAATDPLTQCLNRRAFTNRLNTECSLARKHGYNLSCVFVDIDHFKAVNDEHGHSVGDVVLRSLAETLRAGVRVTDTVCRYGGEEFCLLLSHANTEKAVQIAESLRQRIAIKKVRGITVTASFGVSCLTTQGTGARQLIDQADQALYAAKDSGRNQVVLWNDISTTAEDTDRCPAKTTDEGGQNTDEINIRAVRVLVAALAHRDPGTAAHSRQVADLCVALAKGFLSRHDCFVLEVAGQLHDIGKLGVPDSILYKPDALTEAELKTVHAHLRFGIETVAATCSSAQLTEILRARYACYGGNPEEPDLPTGKDIPPGARILAICDAFSAMVSPRPFRHAFTREKAFEELRRSAGTQFDPELVERFIEVLLASDKAQTPTASDVIASEAARR